MGFPHVCLVYPVFPKVSLTKWRFPKMWILDTPETISTLDHFSVETHGFGNPLGSTQIEQTKKLEMPNTLGGIVLGSNLRLKRGGTILKLSCNK